MVAVVLKQLKNGSGAVIAGIVDHQHHAALRVGFQELP
jgi:hypothetical protein